MNYELVKQLKDAGYKFRKDEDGQEFPYFTYGTDEPIEHCAYCDNKVFIDQDTYEIHYLPTLSELIEKCGDDGIFLWKYNKVWCAKAVDPVYHCFTDEYIDDKFSPQKGSTPEEAVAKLWLELNNNY